VVPRDSGLSEAATSGDIMSTAQGKAVTERLGRGEHVGPHVVEGWRRRLPGAADAALHLVEYQQRPDLITARAQRAEEWPPRSHRPGEPLHGLDESRPPYAS